MSLLDDVSIVVTPNGYKAGELYAVIPSNGDADMDVTRATAATRVDENGLVNYAEIVSDTELVTNGDFATDSDWTKGTGWTISEGNLNASNVNAVSTTQSGYTFVGKTFQVSYTISDYSQGSVQIYLGGSQSTSLKSVNGTHTETISISSGNTLLYIYGASNFTGNINNVSVKEVTRNNVPRIDYTGGGCPHILAEPQRTNIVFPSDVAVTQTRTVTAVEYALSFYGTGSIVLSGTHSATLTGTGVNDRVDLIFTPTAGSLVLTVSGTVTNFQLEVGSYATSLIPTVSGIVTRNQDIFTRDGIGSLINSPEGVLFVEMAALSDDSTRRVISLSDGTNTNRVVLRYDNASNRVQGFIQVSGATNGNINDNSYTITNFLKIAYKWKAGDFALWINGTEVATSTDATSFGAGVLTEMQFNEGDGAGSEYFGKVKQLQVYDTALTDTQLAALTS